MVTEMARQNSRRVQENANGDDQRRKEKEEADAGHQQIGGDTTMAALRIGLVRTARAQTGQTGRVQNEPQEHEYAYAHENKVEIFVAVRD